MMKIVMIHGQSHEGSTCMVARELADKVGGEVQEFFLPRDFARPCCGCFTCFKTDLSKCPHFKELEPLERAILDADLLILDSPVYVYHATGQMMSFLDHFGTWWVVHRPMPEMSRKQAVAISTAAGGGMKSTVRDMADSLEMWGIHKVYKLGVGVQAAKPEEIPAGIMKNIHRKTDRLASQIQKKTQAHAGAMSGQGCGSTSCVSLTGISHPWNRIMDIGRNGAGMGAADRGISDADENKLEFAGAQCAEYKQLRRIPL